jgi:hypothetical protein
MDSQDARDTEIKNLPSLESMVAAIPKISIDKDEDLTADFKAEKISAETVGVADVQKVEASKQMWDSAASCYSSGCYPYLCPLSTPVPD